MTQAVASARARLGQQYAEWARQAPGGGAPSRGRRFAMRVRGERLPSLADVAHIPAWRLADPALHRAIARAAATLFHRPQLDRMLSGDALRHLAVLNGEDVLDALLRAPVSDAMAQADADAMLPNAASMDAVGELLLERSVTPDNAAIRALCDAAAVIVQRHGGTA